MNTHDTIHAIGFILIVMGIPFIGALLIDYIANRFKNLK